MIPYIIHCKSAQDKNYNITGMQYGKEVPRVLATKSEEDIDFQTVQPRVQPRVLSSSHRNGKPNQVAHQGNRNSITPALNRNDGEILSIGKRKIIKPESGQSLN